MGKVYYYLENSSIPNLMAISFIICDKNIFLLIHYFGVFKILCPNLAARLKRNIKCKYAFVEKFFKYRMA